MKLLNWDVSKRLGSVISCTVDISESIEILFVIETQRHRLNIEEIDGDNYH